jgi:hypothetical protein
MPVSTERCRTFGKWLDRGSKTGEPNWQFFPIPTPADGDEGEERAVKLS